MIKEAIQFKKSYLDWLGETLKVSEIGECVRIDAPFLDRHNDFISFYVKPENGGYFLTDDGFTVNDLLMSGCDISTPKRTSILNEILNGFGVSLSNDNELTIRADHNNFALKKHMLIQAILSVDDMFMMTQNYVASVFIEDIASFLLEHDIRYSESIQISGSSGLNHTIDFLIPHSKDAPERLIKGINSPTSEKVKSTLFAWEDLRPLRKNNPNFFILLNDTNKTINTDLISAIKSKDATPILWSGRTEFVQELSA